MIILVAITGIVGGFLMGFVFGFQLAQKVTGEQLDDFIGFKETDIEAKE